MRPTYHQLRAFNAVADCGSFSRAAAQLGVSQPAVTAQVRALEERFGITLFERTGSGTRPTPVGRRLHLATRKLAEVEDAAVDVLTAVHQLRSGTLRIVAGAPHPGMLVISRFARAYPGISISTSFGNWDQVVAALLDGTAEVGLLTGAPRDPRFAAQAFTEQRIVALLPKGHPLAEEESVSLRVLATGPLIFRSSQSLTQKTVDAHLASLGLAPEPMLRLEAREAIYEAVAEGLGVGFMFDKASTRFDGVVRRPIVEIPDIFTEDVFCLRQNRRTRIISALFDTLD